MLINKIFRYKISMICFILGMIVSFLALYYGNRSIYEYNTSVSETDNVHFEYEQKATFYGEKLPIDELPKADNGNCIIHGLYLTIDKPNITTGIWVSLYSNEEYLFPLARGRYPSIEEINGTESIAVIGKRYEVDIYVINDKEYIDIQDESYLVTGILGGNSKEYDAHILLFSDNMGASAKSLLESDCRLWGVDFLFQSNVMDVSQECSKMYDFLKDKGDFVEQSIDYEIYQEVSAEKKISFYLIMVYSSGVTFLISIFWMYERKKEIIIRRKFGFKSGRILLMMLREIFLISLIAVAISTIIYVFVNDHMIGYMRHIFDEAKLFLVTFFLYFLFVTITTLTYPAFIILRKIPNMKME